MGCWYVERQPAANRITNPDFRRVRPNQHTFTGLLFCTSVAFIHKYLSPTSCLLSPPVRRPPSPSLACCWDLLFFKGCQSICTEELRDSSQKKEINRTAIERKEAIFVEPELCSDEPHCGTKEAAMFSSCCDFVTDKEA